MQESSMNKLHPLPHVWINSIHHPPLSGSPLLLLLDRWLVRWPELIALSRVGGWGRKWGVVVYVPPELREEVRQVLFGHHPLDRCNAAKRWSEDRSHARKMVAAAARVMSRKITERCIPARSNKKPVVVCPGVQEGNPCGGMVMMVVIGTRASKQWSGGLTAVSVEEGAR
jgi:hypothetical protein